MLKLLYATRDPVGNNASSIANRIFYLTKKNENEYQEHFLGVKAAGA